MSHNTKLSSRKVVSQEEMAKERNQAVLHNHLILEKIFKCFDIFDKKDLLRFRRVSKLWKAVVDPVIAKEIKVDFYDWKFAYPFTAIHRELKYFKELNISKVAYSPVHDDFKEVLSFVYDKVIENADQVVQLEMDPCDEADFEMLKKFLVSATNLKELCFTADFDFDYFLEDLKGLCFPNLRSLTMSGDEQDEGEEEDVAKILKLFPNLEKNIEHCELDNLMFRMIGDRKASLKTLKHLCVTASHKWENWGNLSPNCLPLLTKIEVEDMEHLDQKNSDFFTNVLKTFSSTLETVILSSIVSKQVWDSKKGVVVITVPPLPKLRRLILGLPWIEEKVGPVYLWNLGKSLAKGFPLLEDFLLQPTVLCNCHRHLNEKCKHNLGKYDPSTKAALKVWEAFVPIEETVLKNFDLTPLKFLKFVDFSVPPEWVGPQENVEWGKKFLNTYLKLYGSGGRGPVQNLIKWLH